MKPFKVLVCGGRNYGYKLDKQGKIVVIEEERNHIYKTLSDLGGKCFGDKPNPSWMPRPDLEIISGMAMGADTVAVDWASSNWVKVHCFPAEWTDLSHPDAVIRKRQDGTLYDAKAGFRRNTKMLVEGQPDLVLAFPGGKGTAMMVKLARDSGVAVEELKRP